MKIAFTCSSGDGKYFIRPRYVDYITAAAEKFGFDVTPTVLPICAGEGIIKSYALEFDGFLFTGGDDVEPSLYGEERLGCCGDTEPERDRFELKLLDELIKLDKPVFGICRGIQIMNVALGGTLWQDIGQQVLSEPHTYKTESGSPSHVVQLSGFTEKAAGRNELVTNSYHHQAVKLLGDGLEVSAVSGDGIIEAFEHTSLCFYRAVQWHPEINPDSLSYALAKEFLSASDV